MSYKVAVASSDGKFVNQHFGMAQQFLIFEIDDAGEYKFIELRENVPACDVEGHTEDAMSRSIQLISDCKIVIASQIGPGAVDILLKNNIEPYIAPTFIDEALKKLASMNTSK
ncbi:MAG: dinitrogenase iron-molybdenum cofactor biosynthesis protein [Methanobacterium sp.]|jgi:predicted Fe-Mo cluster-binding NifX family protein|nr:dinitrogenase iron-molybdenum cofactor biosynthesis protein [Methanobacterium sp.]